MDEYSQPDAPEDCHAEHSTGRTRRGTKGKWIWVPNAEPVDISDRSEESKEAESSPKSINQQFNGGQNKVSNTVINQ